MATGMLSKPPQGSPGKRPQSNGSPGMRHHSSGSTNKGGKNRRGDKTPNAGLPNLTRKQNQVLGQTQDQDLSIGKAAGKMLPGAEAAYANPFDYGKYEQMMPVQGDFNAWRDQQVQAGNQAFDARFNPQAQQETEDFEQSMANKGIPMGSKLYDQEKTRMEQRQGDAKQQAYFQNLQNAGQNAQQFFDIGNTSEQNKYNMAQTARNAPITEYATMKGLQTGQQNQNLQYSQQQAMQDSQNAAQIKAAQIAASAAGKGGGFAPPEWQRAGFKSYKDYADDQQARSIYQYQNTVGQNQPKAGNPYAGIAGTALGVGASILANKYL